MEVGSMKLTSPIGAPQWALDLIRQIERGARGFPEHPVRLPSFTVAALPDAAHWRGGMIIVADETDGEVPAWSDGTSWRRLTDRAVCS